MLFPLANQTPSLSTSSTWTAMRSLLLLLVQVALMKWECRDLRHGEDTWTRPTRREGKVSGMHSYVDIAAQFDALVGHPGLGRRSSQDDSEVPMPSIPVSRWRGSVLRKTRPVSHVRILVGREGINLRQLRVRCHARKSRCSKP